MKSEIVSRHLFFITSILTLTIIAFIAGLYSGVHKTLPYHIVSKIKADVESVVDDLDNLTGRVPKNWVIPKRFPADGVTLNILPNSSADLVLLQGFFGDNLGLRLLKRDGNMVANWNIQYSTFSENVTHLHHPPSTDWNVGFHGAALLPDGGAVFNFDHIGLVRLDRCGDLIWFVDRPTHHSIELNEDGSFWVPSAQGVEVLSNDFPPLYRPEYSEDTLLHISADGDIIEEISLLEVFFKSNELGLLTLTGGIQPGRLMEAFRPDYKKEVFHLNDVEALPSDYAPEYPMFEAGDLLVSIRNRNLIFVMDPTSRKIKWWHIGPWIRQHDPDWSANGLITLFDNNRDGTDSGKVLGGSRILTIDPATKNTSVLYGDSEDEFFYSERRGKHQFLANDNLLVVEAEAGRVFEVDKNKNKVWEYVNHYSNEFNARITGARIYSQDYFTVDNWSCLQR